MKKYYYDLHVHSCLSPCGDDDNTPNNIAGMAKLCEIDIVALTDHNSSKNCPAFFEAAKRNGILPIAGMELTTAEDIHVVCLFERLEDAMSFDKYVYDNRIRIKNKPEIFGNQLILDKDDEPIGEVEELLINATNISVSEIADVVNSFSGICYPAHVDKEANSIISVLGTLPRNSGFKIFEIHNKDNIEKYSQLYGIPMDRFIVSSDAHYLTDFKDRENYIELDDGLTDADAIRRSLFHFFRRTDE